MPSRATVVSGLATLCVMALVSACGSRPSPSQTGMAELDAIVEVATKGDVQDLQRFIGYTESRCTHAEGLGGPPKCLEGEEEGAAVEVLPILGPEGGFIRKDDIGSWQGVQVSRLHAAYEVSRAAYSDANYPAGEYALVFLGEPDSQSSLTLQVRKGKIVRIDYGLTYPPVIRPEDVLRYLVRPSEASP